jgi:hypothetical protein
MSQPSVAVSDELRDNEEADRNGCVAPQDAIEDDRPFDRREIDERVPYNTEPDDRVGDRNTQSATMP